MGTLIVNQYLSKLWTPAEITTALWLDAADSSSITIINGVVSEWQDKSSNLYVASQSTPLNSPTYTLDGLNGKAVISFNGSNILNLPSISLGNFAVTVAKRSALNQPVLEAEGDAGRGFWGFPGGNPSYVAYNNYSVDGSDLASLEELESAVSRYAIVSSTNYIAGVRKWLIGEGRPGFAKLNGGIAEIVSGNDLGQLQKAQGYLAHKWELAANLPVTHPYKNNPPYV